MPLLPAKRNFLPAGGNAGLPLDSGATQGVKIALDSIVHVTSGLMDKNNSFVYSYLQKAIRPLNQLRTLEDATKQVADEQYKEYIAKVVEKK